jgi:hypothetical protein
MPTSDEASTGHRGSEPSAGRDVGALVVMSTHPLSEAPHCPRFVAYGDVWSDVHKHPFSTNMGHCEHRSRFCCRGAAAWGWLAGGGCVYMCGCECDWTSKLLAFGIVLLEPTNSRCKLSWSASHNPFALRDSIKHSCLIPKLTMRHYDVHIQW